MRFRGVAVLAAAFVIASTVLACSIGSDTTPSSTPSSVAPPTATAAASLGPVATATAPATARSGSPVDRQASATATSPAGAARVLTAPAPAVRPVVSGPQVLTLVGSALGPTTLDPALIRDAEGAFIARQIFRGLVRLDNDLIVQPDIASRIEISPDGLHYTFHLRENAVFHNGAPIDAAAVVASFNRAADPALAAGDGSSLPAYLYFASIQGALARMDGTAQTISGIVARNSLTVEFTLVQPSVTFLSMMTGACALIVDAATTLDADWWVEPNGSGPFVLDELSSSLLLLTGFEDFYDGAPALTEVRILQGSASSQPLNLYEGATVDVVDVPFYSLDRVLSPTDSLYPQLRIEPQLSSTFLLMNPNMEPFDDLNLRLAVAHAFDRAKLVRVGFDGKVQLASGIVPPAILGRDWDSAPLSYDTALALSLYAQVDDLSLNPTIYGSLGTTFKRVLERDLGMQVDVIVPEWPLFAARLTESTLPAFVLSWIADYPDPSNFLYSMFHSASPDNYIDYANPAVDTLLDQAAREQDDDARAALYLAAQQLLIDDAVLVPLYHDVSYVLVKPHVRGLDVTPVGLGSLETVWIER